MDPYTTTPDAPLPDLPAVFRRSGTADHQRHLQAEKLTLLVVAVLALAAAAFWAADAAGVYAFPGLAELRANLEESLGRRTSRWVVFLVVLAPLALVARGVSRLRGRDDSITVHREGIVYARGPQDSDLIRWDEIAHIQTLLGVDLLVLEPPMSLRLGRGKSERLSWVPIGQLDPDWRNGDLGALIRHLAPRLFAPELDASQRAA